MSGSEIKTLEEQLEQLLQEPVPDQAVYNVNAAMQLASIIEAKGFTFQLKDMCPKSLIETNWRATFLKEGEVFSAEHAQSSMAICLAAVDVLASLPENKN
ncbi:hypothetical protein [uncultured Desulfobacter sp.]|uniref:hypothetical protein n=1 Tax=uncultured Desulfobacter sp. TaxID=240139 RepID=UPI002AAB3162|nr:hypothetical protein [uncultured Desulfobacter sp.]